MEVANQITQSLSINKEGTLVYIDDMVIIGEYDQIILSQTVSSKGV